MILIKRIGAFFSAGGRYLFEIARRYVSLNGNFHAKAIAFSLLFTFIPIIMVLLWAISSLLSGSSELLSAFIDKVLELVPLTASEMIRERIEGIVTSRSWRNVGIVGVFVLFWAPNGLFSSLNYGLHVMMQQEPKGKRSFWIRHILQFTTHYLIALFIVIFTLISFVINSAVSAEDLPVILRVVKSYWASTAALFATLVMIYSTSYSGKIHKGALVTVSLLISVLWHLFNYLGTEIISGSGRIEAFYGFFAGAAVVMMWTFIFSISILVGGVVIARHSKG
ncbi:MAG: YihY/virulence factor BrkB family protein [Fibrobacterota bacterium]